MFNVNIYLLDLELERLRGESNINRDKYER